MAQQKKNNGNNPWGKSKKSTKAQGSGQWKKKTQNQENKASQPKQSAQSGDANTNNNGMNSSAFRYRVVKGDLFSAPQSASLCHCVSQCLGMGKGIAVLFKRQFGGVDTLRRQKVEVGGVGVLMRQNRFVYYLITKPRYFHKPTYETLSHSLENMKNHAMFNGVTAICMPKIGCGLDRLQWNRVEGIIKDTFKATNISITVYEL